MSNSRALATESAATRDPVERRIDASARLRTGPLGDLSGFTDWFADYGRRAYTHVDRVPLEALEGWETDPGTGDLRHHTGRFFTVHGLEVSNPGAPVAQWTQPIINQPEIGILGILTAPIDGVLHCLMQAKVEPGNAEGLQLSPTVQATRSNYTRVHQGRAVPYLEHFMDIHSRPGVLADVRQSEQGSWFYRKRNRNVVVELPEPVEALDGYRWMTLGQIHELLGRRDTVNMDARTVLSCLPFTGPDVEQPDGDDFRSALLRSGDPGATGVHSAAEILGWITDRRTSSDIAVRRVALGELRDWSRTDDRIRHDAGAFFDVIGVQVDAGGREVHRWSQPMIEPVGQGVIAFLVRRFEGVLHVLVHARVEPGFADVVELGPTVQCVAESHAQLPGQAAPPFLDEVLGAPAERVRFDTVLSEEGGRFFHALNRYLIVETDQDVPRDHPDHRWMTLHQLSDLLRHSHYVNVQARSLIACLHSLYHAG
ncbi:NDP-hexose 2,3-dehydratase family protein [Streptomyces violarus]|uniref:NDP-hexose 2,3-dehydratase family protein n=1 Tax=Streptomyces violarus TaxID=67380 RepID=UPI0021BE0184|nr:NDP-hexose 2,3-dehydratase family protein [Streptomyces violarus]MCT9142464.1 NDP-hexose 2,3-dehydratase family protein [Streptomyces violarus]